jgi:hypothetical protein
MLDHAQLHRDSLVIDGLNAGGPHKDWVPLLRDAGVDAFVSTMGWMQGARMTFQDIAFLRERIDESADQVTFATTAREIEQARAIGKTAVVLCSQNTRLIEDEVRLLDAFHAVGVRIIRGSRLSQAAQEIVAGVLALTPAILSLRGNDLAAYHGAEHISIGTYEHDEPRAREHERCGSHLIGPLLATTAAANVVAATVPPRFRRSARAVASLGAIAAATELFGWMVRNPEKRLARVLAKPGHELQHRYATKQPNPAQVEVAEAALHACLALETSHQEAA